MVRLPGKYLIPLVIVYLLYATIFIYQTSFILNGERYFSLFDDAMVAMRYARNLADGYGLVWNPGGERVEGVTTPLWTFYMAFWHLVGLPESKISLAIQLTSAALLARNLVLSGLGLQGLPYLAARATTVPCSRERPDGDRRVVTPGDYI